MASPLGDGCSYVLLNIANSQSLVLYVFFHLILTIFQVCIITPSLHETKEAKLFLQVHISELALEPGALQSPCSKYHMAPFPAPKQT